VAKTLLLTKTIFAVTVVSFDIAVVARKMDIAVVARKIVLTPHPPGKNDPKNDPIPFSERSAGRDRETGNISPFLTTVIIHKGHMEPTIPNTQPNRHPSPKEERMKSIKVLSSGPRNARPTNKPGII